eukprot:jgi/Mesvir1/1081/Mv17594-RA.1
MAGLTVAAACTSSVTFHAGQLLAGHADNSRKTAEALKKINSGFLGDKRGLRVVDQGKQHMGRPSRLVCRAENPSVRITASEAAPAAKPAERAPAEVASVPAPSSDVIELFADVASTDFLKFEFGGRSYDEQIKGSISKTQVFSGVKVEVRTLFQPEAVLPSEDDPHYHEREDELHPVPVRCVWVTHNFGFLGGSLGCAEGEKLVRAFEYAREAHLPVVVECHSGGARMQEGTSSLMQMAKVSVAVEALRRDGLPFISILEDPTYGGVSASYAMQADIRIGITDARVGFAGPQVILNTMFNMDQAKFDEACPPDFQSAEYVRDHGQIDIVINKEDVIKKVYHLTWLLMEPQGGPIHEDLSRILPTPEEKNITPDYTASRAITRPQVQDVITTVFNDFIDLRGDGKQAIDACMIGGLAKLGGRTVVVVGTAKGHTPQEMLATNYGMPSPAGYRTALRLFKLAQRLGIPVVTLVDTPGAWPSFEAERDGQSEAIATNLTTMAGLGVPIITIVLGEGGSGGALGLGMGNKIGMLSKAYYGVITPEGAASILGRYKNAEEKKTQFPKDCQELATTQQIYAPQLEKLGIVDDIIYECVESESWTDFPTLASRIAHFIETSLVEMEQMSEDELIAQRYAKFRSMGQFSILSKNERAELIAKLAEKEPEVKKKAVKEDTSPSPLIQWLANETINGSRSRFRKKHPAGMPLNPPKAPEVPAREFPKRTPRKILDEEGPEALAKWVRANTHTMMTDTTMRDAHQSLHATRFRTEDIVEGGRISNTVLGTRSNMFSFECWGGATFDVAYNFLKEDPWERLRELKKAMPDVLTQMLVRGSNVVGYKNYPKNVINEFVRLAAKNGMDVFRIFDCFNDIDNMKSTIDAVRANRKVAEVAICYTSDIETSKIYTPDYYADLAKRAAQAGAHFIGIKDMAGLLKPRAVGPIVTAIRRGLKEAGADLPLHFHTHATSSASLATCVEMSRFNVDVVDFATASMADCTSQPSLNAFVASLRGDKEHDPEVNYLDLEPLDSFWSRVRTLYQPFECGMHSGTARVFDHQIPGGQYSNLLVQCRSMGIFDKWEQVLDMYRDVNYLFGDIVKVTPSSKCVGDLALYLVTRGLTCKDVLDPEKAKTIDFPASSIELMEGRLGYPHHGFPKEVQTIILKGRQPLTREEVYSGGEDIDLAKEKEKLEAKWKRPMSEEDVISSVIYPKVFDEYMEFVSKYSTLPSRLSTPVFWYAMEVGQTTTMKVPIKNAKELNLTEAEAMAAQIKDSPDLFLATIKLQRVSPVQHGKIRTVTFSVNGKTQVVDVQIAGDTKKFTGKMAEAGNKMQVAVPMNGTLDKLFVKPGDVVKEGQLLAQVGAMKMEVDVKAKASGTVASVPLAVGQQVAEGALLLSLK